MDWDTPQLSEAQINYASLDVYATWAIYDALNSVSAGALVAIATPGGTAVSLYGPDQSSIVAQGHIAMERPKKHLGVTLTPHRVLVVITTVLNPSHIVPKELLGPKSSGSQDTPFLALPSPPFTLVCKAKHVRTRVDAVAAPIPSEADLTTIHFQTASASSTTSAALDPGDDALDSDVPSQTPAQDSAHSWHQDTDAILDSEQLLTDSQPDAEGMARADSLRKQLVNHMLKGEGTMRSRVLGDIWHLMDQFYISVNHGLCRAFARALRNAFFIPDAEDKATLEAFLHSKDITWDRMVLYHSRWLWQRVRRFVPPPEELLARVTKVIMMYGPLKDATTGLPLFNERCWDTSINVIENVRRGYYSDPPNIQLYFSSGTDKHGLARYKCCHGTNGIEGGVHQNIIRWFGAFNAAPDFAVQLLRDYVLYHNLKASSLYASV